MQATRKHGSEVVVDVTMLSRLKPCFSNAQIGPGWLNPTEGAVWPLEETLQVAHLAFQGLNAHAEGLPHGDGERNCAFAAVLLQLQPHNFEAK